jgi:hypothetical protein
MQKNEKSTGGRRWRRWIVRGAVVVVLGVVASVGSAWMMAAKEAWYRRNAKEFARRVQSGAVTSTPCVSTPPGTDSERTLVRGAALGMELWGVVPGNPYTKNRGERVPWPRLLAVPAGSSATTSVVAYGWPYLSMYTRSTTTLGPSGGLWKATERFQGRASVQVMSGYVIDLPLLPEWRGLMADTMIYGALLGLAWWTPGAFRRGRRRRRGWCTRCGYALGGTTSAHCPECGTPFPARRAHDGCQGLQPLVPEVSPLFLRPAGRTARALTGEETEEVARAPGAEAPGNHRAPSGRREERLNEGSGT